MTVDIIIETTQKPSVLIYYKDVAPIGWERVFEIINFNPKLLYDNCPNFWSTSQLEYVVKRLERLCNDQNYFMIDEGEHSVLLPCIKTLIEQFTKYIEDKCIMVIY
jgi:hypothetical protein